MLDDLHRGAPEEVHAFLAELCRYARRSRWIVTTRAAPSIDALAGRVLRLGAMHAADMKRLARALNLRLLLEAGQHEEAAALLEAAGEARLEAGYAVTLWNLHPEARHEERVLRAVALLLAGDTAGAIEEARAAGPCAWPDSTGTPYSQRKGTYGRCRPRIAGAIVTCRPSGTSLRADPRSSRPGQTAGSAGGGAAGERARDEQVDS